LATSDSGDARSFYTRLFGWDGVAELTASAAGAFTMLRRGGREVAVLYRQMPEARAAGAPPHWTSFISVDDADATAARANELGGAAVFREPFDVLDAGCVAAIRDPTGALVSLWQPRSLPGATLVNDVGALCWNELATTDVELAKSFFGLLLGWEYETDDSGYVSIGNAGRLNGGIRKQTEDERGIPPSWLPYFTVERTPMTRCARPSGWVGAGWCRRPKSKPAASRSLPTVRARRSRSSRARQTPNGVSLPR
jgi:predicted enzyme related to lactoylglutathione lyase